MSADRLGPPADGDGMAPMLWRMVAIALAWFALLGLVMLLTGPTRHHERAAPGATERPAAGAEPLRTRSLRHGGSAPAPPAAL
ncbi:hypothetical protein [Plastoroseomonas arctica]|uniref:Uncharacterized protein n=1 Tax=Plastoroseomonas arctica TaxID=1509237 RepID=A0AAF1KRR8_9PROT|nr:hypothetical protein [Plastoroseomonas arctica]MBR0654672.1 hypothetical protein [Plastoroseomonas arctica]